MHGAAAAFTRCTFRACFGLIASGGTTIATLSDCHFHGCVASIVAEAGAMVSADATVVSGTDAAAFSNGPNTSVSLTECILCGGRGTIFGMRDIVAAGGAVSVHGGEIPDFGDGLHATGASACMEAHRVLLTRLLYAVVLRKGARFTGRELYSDLPDPERIEDLGPDAVHGALSMWGPGDGKGGMHAKSNAAPSVVARTQPSSCPAAACSRRSSVHLSRASVACTWWRRRLARCCTTAQHTAHTAHVWPMESAVCCGCRAARS